MLVIKVERNRKAPEPINKRTGNRGYWSPIMTSMDKGNWFSVDKLNYGRVQAAGNKYLKGQYSFYKHPTKADSYVFVRTA